jgi:DNA polymerase III delta subunit
MLMLRHQGTLPARSVFMKLASGADWTVEAYPAPRGRELVEWVSARAQRAGAMIDQAAAEDLLQRLFPNVWRQEGRYETLTIDMRLLATEVEKLACAADGAIESALVDELILDRSGYTPFKLADDVFEGRTEAALRELDQVLATGEPPERLLAQLARETTAQVAARQVDQFDTKQVADASEISAGQLGVIVQRKSAWRKAQALGLAAEETRRAEWLVKTGRSPRAESVIVPLVAALAETFRATPGPRRGRRG